MAYDERGLQSLGIVTQKTDKTTKKKVVTKPMFIYTTKDVVGDTASGYFKSDKTPCLLSNTALDGSLMFIRGFAKTIVRKISVNSSGVVTTSAIDTIANGTGTTTKLFDPSLLNMVGANTMNEGERANVVWLYSSNEDLAEVVKPKFFEAKSTNPMQKMAEFDKVRQINNGDVLIATGLTGTTVKTMIKVFKKQGDGAITLEDYDKGTVGVSPGVGITWDVKKMQMLGSSIATLKSNANSIRNKANLIDTATIFLVHDNQTLAKMVHDDYWKYENTTNTKPDNTEDVAKWSYAKANVKTGDVIIIKATDKTTIRKIIVDQTTNKITVHDLDA